MLDLKTNRILYNGQIKKTDSLDITKKLSMVDVNSGYLQIEMDGNNREKTIFTSSCGLFQFIRTPFGLKTSRATFQRVVNVTLTSVISHFSLLYLCSIVIFSRIPQKHMQYAETEPSLLKVAAAILKLEKCAFITNDINYLQHAI